MINWMSSCSVAGLLKRLAICATMLATSCASGIERYVCVSNATPVAPYTNWTTAATTIQAAVDVASVGDTVWVTNGVYRTGGKRTPDYDFVTLSNRLIITQEIIVRSVNGPEETIIEGSGEGSYNTSRAMRCVYMSAGVLDGFTLQGGATYSDVYSCEVGGGGVYKSDFSPVAVVSNCIIRNCRAVYGGGSYGCSLYRCRLIGNTAKVAVALIWANSKPARSRATRLSWGAGPIGLHCTTAF